MFNRGERDNLVSISSTTLFILSAFLFQAALRLTCQLYMPICVLTEVNNGLSNDQPVSAEKSVQGHEFGILGPNKLFSQRGFKIAERLLDVIVTAWA